MYFLLICAIEVHPTDSTLTDVGKIDLSLVVVEIDRMHDRVKPREGAQFLGVDIVLPDVEVVGEEQKGRIATF